MIVWPAVKLLLMLSSDTLEESLASARVPVVSWLASFDPVGVAGTHSVPFQVATCPEVAADWVRAESGCVWLAAAAPMSEAVRASLPPVAWEDLCAVGVRLAEGLSGV